MFDAKEKLDIKSVCSFLSAVDGQSYTAYHPFFNGTFSFAVFVRGQVVEGFPLDINIGDIRPRVRSAKKAIAGNGTKFGKLGDPQGVAVSEEGNVIVSDSRNHRLQVGKFMSNHCKNCHELCA